MKKANNVRAMYRLIDKHISIGERAQLKVSLRYIAKGVEQTRDEFCPGKTLEEVFMEEMPYYKAYGMSAFGAGYCGKSKSGAHKEFQTQQ